jgi:hypothetical protein
VYGKFMSRIQLRMNGGTGKYSPNGTRCRFTYTWGVGVKATKIF